jgi:hypothetical protein
MPSFPDFAGCEGFLFGAPPAFQPRSGLSTKNRPLNSFSGQIERSDMKQNTLALALAGLFLVPSTTLGQFAGSVIAYDHGTGFAANFTNANAALGAPASAGSVTPYAPPFSTSQLVSIGAGGSLTLQFGTPIANDPTHPYGMDFLIFGNSFFVTTNGSGSSAKTSGAIFTSSVSTRVEVSADATTWFTLDPSLAPTVGTLFPTDGPGNPLMPVNPALTGSDFAGSNLSGIRSLYSGSAGGGGFDLGWARDGDGKAVTIESVSYVRIDVLNGRTQIDAVSVVPEPSVWAMVMLAGALLVISRIEKPETRGQSTERS